MQEAKAWVWHGLKRQSGTLGLHEIRVNANTPNHSSRYSLRVEGLEKEVFGSVTFRFDVPFPPFWHEEENEAINAARMNRAAQLNCFRIRNESRTNDRCKLTKRVRNKIRKWRTVLFSAYFLSYGQEHQSAVE